MNSFVFLMILVVISSVVFNQSTKLYFKNAKNVGASTILAQVCGALGGLIWFFFFPIDFSMRLELWGLLVLACVFYAINDRFGADVKKNLDVSVFSLLDRTSDVFLIIISILFFRQIPSTWKIVSAVFIILGQIVLSYRKRKFQINKYFLLALMTNLVFSIAVSIDIGISDQINLPLYVAITLVVPSLFIWIGERISLKELQEEFKTSDKKYLIATGLSWGTFIVVLLSAYQAGSIISVIILNAISIIINVLIGILVQKERENIQAKITAMSLVALGVLLTIFK